MKFNLRTNKVADTILIWSVRVIVILIILGIIWAQNNLLTVSSMTYQDTNIPKTFVGYKIVHISDIKNSGLNVAGAVKKLNPDVILITGGYSDANGNSNNTVKTINKLAQIAPVYYIYNPGDTDGVLSNTSAVNITNTSVQLNCKVTDPRTFIENIYGKDILTKADGGDEESQLYLQYITEQIANLQGSTLNLFGLANYTEENGQYSARDKAYELILNSSSDYEIALLGNINLLNEVCKAEINMLFFGGTFGTNKISNTYTKGMYANNGTQLFVSGGIGKSEGVVRIFNFPEIQCITLSDGTIENKNPLEKLLGFIIKDVGTVFDNDGGFEVYKYDYGNRAVDR